MQIEWNAKLHKQELEILFEIVGHQDCETRPISAIQRYLQRPSQNRPLMQLRKCMCFSQEIRSLLVFWKTRGLVGNEETR